MRKRSVLVSSFVIALPRVSGELPIDDRFICRLYGITHTYTRCSMMEEPEDWEEEERKRWEGFERRWEERAEEMSKRIGEAVERAMEKSFKMAAIGSRLFIGPHSLRRRMREELRHPIPIRYLNREFYRRIRDLARDRDVPVGHVMSEAMRYYLLHSDIATLEESKRRILRKLEEIESPERIEDKEMRATLKEEYKEMLEEVKKKIEDLKKEKEREKEREKEKEKKQ